MSVDEQLPNKPRVRVILPAALIRLFPGAPEELTIAADSVAELLMALDEQWPGMRARLQDERPSIRRHINVFVDGRRAGLDTPLPPEGEVYIMTAISGG